MLKLIFLSTKGRASIAENLMQCMLLQVFCFLKCSMTLGITLLSHIHTYLWRRLLYTALQRRSVVCHTLRKTLNTHYRALSS